MSGMSWSRCLRVGASVSALTWAYGGAGDGFWGVQVTDSKFDYEPVFNAMLAPLVVLTPDLVIVAANNSYLKATGRSRTDMLGQPIFTAFPANPEAHNDPNARGVRVLRASLERVVATGKAESLPLQRHDLEVAGEPGLFVERYWSSINTPVLGSVLWIR